MQFAAKLNVNSAIHRNWKGRSRIGGHIHGVPFCLTEQGTYEAKNVPEDKIPEFAGTKDVTLELYADKPALDGTSAPIYEEEVQKAFNDPTTVVEDIEDPNTVEDEVVKESQAVLTPAATVAHDQITPAEAKSVKEDKHPIKQQPFVPPETKESTVPVQAVEYDEDTNYSNDEFIPITKENKVVTDNKLIEEQDIPANAPHEAPKKRGRPAKAK